MTLHKTKTASLWPCVPLSRNTTEAWLFYQDRPGPEAAEDGEGDQVAAGHGDAGAAPGPWSGGHMTTDDAL